MDSWDTHRIRLVLQRGGLTEWPSSIGERRKLDSGRKKVGNKVGWLGKLTTTMEVARCVLYR
jgi:hypothetical protein